MKNTQPSTLLAQSSQTVHLPDRSSPLESSCHLAKVNPITVLIADIQVIYQSDPAVGNWIEVLLCYPGLQALLCYRIAHWLYSIGIPVLPRFLSQLSRWLTGVEIHPGARIGKGVFIDHGMGVVIGETVVIGDDVLIYQGATLGGTGKEKDKRHPTLGNHVVVGAGAKVLGNIQIGDHVRIGAGSVVLRDVPSHCTVVGVPGRIARRNGSRANELEHNDLRDIEAEVIRKLYDRLKMLENQVEQLQAQVQGSQNPTARTAQTDEIIEEFFYGAGI